MQPKRIKSKNNDIFENGRRPQFKKGMQSKTIESKNNGCGKAPGNLVCLLKWFIIPQQRINSVQEYMRMFVYIFLDNHQLPNQQSLNLHGLKLHQLLCLSLIGSFSKHTVCFKNASIGNRNFWK